MKITPEELERFHQYMIDFKPVQMPGMFMDTESGEVLSITDPERLRAWLKEHDDNQS
jgi:hypothetical protein